MWFCAWLIMSQWSPPKAQPSLWYKYLGLSAFWFLNQRRFLDVRWNVSMKLKEVTLPSFQALMIYFYSFSYSVDLLVTKDCSLTVTLRDSVKFVILLHKVWKKHPYHRDYLGFYTLDSHLLSPGVHGLLGTTWHISSLNLWFITDIF